MSAPEETTTARSLTSEEFRDVIGRFATGVTVITTTDVGSERLGTTASAVSSLSLDPPMVLICMNETSSTGQAIGRSKAFAVNILGEDQGQLAKHFASKDPDKFASVPLIHGPGGQPLLDQALASLECRVVEEVVGGTHRVFLAEVDHAVARDVAPLAYFRGQFGRLELDNDARAYEALRQKLLDGELVAGQPLDLPALADALGLPPVPLQLALGRLQSEGLLVHGEDGFEVPPVSWEAVREALRGRCTIELGVIDQTVGRTSPEDLARLRTAHESWTPVTEGVRWDRRHAESMDFHDTMVSLAGSPALLAAYRQLRVPAVLAGAFRGYELSERDEAYGGEHQDLVEAYEAGDVERARAVVIAHTERIESAARSVLSGDAS